MTHATPPEGRFATLSDRKFFPLDLQPEDLHNLWAEIAHSQGQLNRWCGHSARPISVAQHAVVVARVAAKRVRLRGGSMREAQIALGWGLVHDVPESLGFSDVAAPIKALMPEYVVAERRAMAVVCAVLCLPVDMPTEVAMADLDVRWAESRDQRPRCPPLGTVPFDVARITAWDARRAERTWLELFNTAFGTEYDPIEIPPEVADEAGVGL